MLLNKLSLIRVYIVWVILGIVLWVPFQDLSHFIGASSIIYSVLFAIGIESSFVGHLLLLYIPIFIGCLVFSYILARFKNKFLPFVFLAGIEIIVSLLFILCKIFILKNTFEITMLWGGFFVRSIVYITVLRLFRSTSKEVIN